MDQQVGLVFFYDFNNTHTRVSDYFRIQSFLQQQQQQQQHERRFEFIIKYVCVCVIVKVGINDQWTVIGEK